MKLALIIRQIGFLIEYRAHRGRVIPILMQLTLTPTPAPTAAIGGEKRRLSYTHKTRRASGREQAGAERGAACWSVMNFQEKCSERESE